jgi:glutamate/tyrosine decarboxylase-like PLP-dependent enzyme
VQDWQAKAGPLPLHPSVAVDEDRLGAAVDELVARLGDNYPFHHPRYAGQMLKPPHPVAMVGYFATMAINPNNHALDGGPATAAMEKEVVADLAGMFGFGQHLGHLTSSGTMANLEALYVARELHPGKAIAHSTDSHYTHARMCQVLGVESIAVPTDAPGHLDVDALGDLLATGRVGTVVATAGTTGLGAVDPIDEIVSVAREHGVRVHVDAAYGGFFRLLATGEDDAAGGVAPGPWRAIARADSVVVDPHKHGLQPYGCGAVLFADPSVGRFYAHDSPYTYFTSDELHLGEISLECSRAGAAAAALWLTLELFPLSREGLGAVLAAGRRAALHWHGLLETSSTLRPFVRPELDIVTYSTRATRASKVDADSARILAAGMADDVDPVYLSTLRIASDRLHARCPDVAPDVADARILRSVLMKPESENHVEWLHARVESLI